MSTGLENPSVIKHVPISDIPIIVRPIPVIKQKALVTSEIKIIEIISQTLLLLLFGYVPSAVEAVEASNRVCGPVGRALCDEHDGQPR